jgi:hypothetical protein
MVSEFVVCFRIPSKWANYEMCRASLAPYFNLPEHLLHEWKDCGQQFGWRRQADDENCWLLQTPWRMSDFGGWRWNFSLFIVTVVPSSAPYLNLPEHLLHECKDCRYKLVVIASTIYLCYRYFTDAVQHAKSWIVISVDRVPSSYCSSEFFY